MEDGLRIWLLTSQSLQMENGFLDFLLGRALRRRCGSGLIPEPLDSADFADIVVLARMPSGVGFRGGERATENWESGEIAIRARSGPAHGAQQRANKRRGEGPGEEEMVVGRLRMRRRFRD
jgi:hypothetical protein